MGYRAIPSCFQCLRDNLRPPCAPSKRVLLSFHETGQYQTACVARSSERASHAEFCLWGWDASVDVECLTDDIARFSGCQKHECRCNFCWLSGPSQRGVVSKVRQLFLGLSFRWLDRGPDWSGGNSVHSDPLGRQLLTNPFAEIIDRSFCGGVVNQHLVGVISLN